MSARRWTAIVVDVDESDADERAAAIGAESIGTELVAVAPGRVRLRVYFESAAGAERAARRLDPASGVRLEAVEDGRWAERYQASLAPFPLGSRFEVQPAGPRPPEEGRIALRLVPGRAFGTGEHATTRLVAAALEVHVAGGSAWLDVGCGTGILAMVAAHLGAESVLALDLDPEAVEIADAAVRVNGLADQVEVRCGSVDASSPGVWDGVAANIETPFFLANADRIARALRPGGRLLASGIAADEADGVERALAAAGLEIRGRVEEGGWALVVASRPEAGSR